MAEVKKQLFYTFFVLPAIAIIFGLAVVVAALISTNDGTIVKNVQQKINEQKLIGNANCFAYEDKGIGRVYNGYIDKKKFTEEILNKCLEFRKASDPGVLIVLKTEGENDVEIATKNLKPTISRTQVKETKPVVVITEDDLIKPGSLTFNYWQ